VDLLCGSPFRPPFCFVGPGSLVLFYALFVISRSQEFKTLQTRLFVCLFVFFCLFPAIFSFSRRGPLPVGLNFLGPGFSLSPVLPLAVAVDNHVIHFLRRVGGTPGTLLCVLGLCYSCCLFGFYFWFAVVPIYHPCGIGPSHSRSLTSKPCTSPP